MHPNLEKYLETFLKLGIILLGLLIAFLVLFYLLPFLGKWLGIIPSYLSPFIIAVLLAFLIDPLVDRVQRRSRLSRGWSVLIVLGVVWGVVGLLLTLAISRLVRELFQLYHTISNYSANLGSLIAKLNSLYLGLHLPPEVIPNNLGTIINTIQHALDISIRGLLSFLGALPEFFTILLIATLATFFFSRDRDLIIKTILGWLPDSWAAGTHGLGRDLGQAMTGFLRAQFILITNTAVICIIGLSILRVEYALTMGLIIGMVDLLPVLGPGAVFVPWIIWQFIVGNLALGCGLLVLYGIIVLIRQLLEPKIVAESIGLHPLATLIALYVGLQALGIIGMILGPVVLVVFQAAKRTGLFHNLFAGRPKS